MKTVEDYMKEFRADRIIGDMDIKADTISDVNDPEELELARSRYERGKIDMELRDAYYDYLNDEDARAKNREIARKYLS